MIAFLATRFLALPPWCIKIIELLVLLAALAASLAWAHHHVYQQGYNDAVAARKAQDNVALVKAESKAAADQKELSDKFLLAQRDRFKENEDAKTTIDALRRRVQSGAAVLRLPAGSAVCSATTGGDTASSTGPIGEERSIQLMSGTADSFVSIGGRIAAGVRRENDLIDAYNTARESCNAK